MRHEKIVAAPVQASIAPGFVPDIDALAAGNLSGDTFLRAAWFAATSGPQPRTLVLRQAGVPVAALPTCLVGPSLAGARKVPGAYWPHRGVLLAQGVTHQQLASLFKGRTGRTLGQVWRIGPMRGNDPSVAVVSEAARLAGWRVLSRPAGTCWVIDLAAARAAGWPRGSTAKRLRRYERNLAAQGAVGWRHVRGSDWTPQVLEQLGQIEATSWIARTTDGSDAKFLTPQQRSQWLSALTDPVLADMLCATILTLDERPVAFCLDLDDGARQYGIAGSYCEDMAPFHVGKMVNYRVMADAIADGQDVLDLGSGDSGYKREMGAVDAYELVDLLFVRNPLLAMALGRVWRSAAVSPEAAADGAAHAGGGHEGRAAVWKPLSDAAGAAGVSAMIAAAALILGD
jgi:CelD/BcsL family acetyltransferase involved in cellulose biosynthesis